MVIPFTLLCARLYIANQSVGKGSINNRGGAGLSVAQSSTLSLLLSFVPRNNKLKRELKPDFHTDPVPFGRSQFAMRQSPKGRSHSSASLAVPWRALREE